MDIQILFMLVIYMCTLKQLCIIQMKSPVCEARIVSYLSYRQRTVSCLLYDSSHNFHLP